MKLTMIVLAAAALVGIGSEAGAQRLDYGRDFTNSDAGGSASTYGSTGYGAYGSSSTVYGTTPQAPAGSGSPADGSTASEAPGNSWTAYGRTNRGANNRGCSGYAFMAYCD